MVPDGQRQQPGKGVHGQVDPQAPHPLLPDRPHSQVNFHNILLYYLSIFWLTLLM